jgi:hypothetical protein
MKPNPQKIKHWMIKSREKINMQKIMIKIIRVKKKLEGV